MKKQIKNPALKDLLVGIQEERAGLRVDTNSSLYFGIYERRENKDTAEQSLVEVKKI